MSTRSPMDQLLDGVEWTARGEVPPEDTSLPYATHEGVLRIGDVVLKVARLNDGRAVIEKGGIDAILGGDVAELFRSIERVEALKRDLLATIEGMQAQKICEDPASGDSPLPIGTTSPLAMEHALRVALSRHGNAAAVRVVVRFSRATHTASFCFCDAAAGAEFVTAADILEALER